MPFHCAAFAENIDPGGALVNIAGVADQSLTVVGESPLLETAARPSPVAV